LQGGAVGGDELFHSTVFRSAFDRNLDALFDRSFPRFFDRHFDANSTIFSTGTSTRTSLGATSAAKASPARTRVTSAARRRYREWQRNCRSRWRCGSGMRGVLAVMESVSKQVHACRVILWRPCGLRCANRKRSRTRRQRHGRPWRHKAGRAANDARGPVQQAQILPKSPVCPPAMALPRRLPRLARCRVIRRKHDLLPFHRYEGRHLPDS
jgi:hypothetical protein